MHKRQNELDKWLKSLFGLTPFTIIPLAGDASFRRYFRIKCGELTRVLMDAPPNKEDILPFINICERLAAIGVHTPTIYAKDYEQGFILLEDMGDQLLLQALTADNSDKLYQAAMTTLLKIQQCPTAPPRLPSFDRNHMMQELSLFRDWFLQAYLGITLNAEEDNLLDETFQRLTTQITTQPQVFIHRDYHSRNLMILEQPHSLTIGVIDFQDAMIGPYAYDLVSLLKDCYIQWPRERVMRWLTYFYQHSPTAQNTTLPEFTRAFDWCGLQRHLKVLGIFCRLYLRDNKPNYLRDLPLTFNYVRACLEDYSELQPLYQFIQRRVHPRFIEKVLP